MFFFWISYLPTRKYILPEDKDAARAEIVNLNYPSPVEFI